ncbi:MAG: low specificity L-threonine aldolase, partial [Lachnospiraceae bacterium]|nr:low specificity L-threonine aldolase [Lachnospiraceae bacterium]
LLGLQFIGLFENGLYEEVGRYTIKLADKLRSTIKELGIPFASINTTNQIFVILEDRQVKALSGEFSMCFFERVDENHCVMRICTSWATKEENVDALISALKAVV